MLGTVASVVLALVVPPSVPAHAVAPTVQIAIPQQQLLLQRHSEQPAANLFPSATMLTAGKDESLMTEEEIQARDDARRTFAIIAFVSAVPSFWAQDVLVWSKEREDPNYKK